MRAASRYIFPIALVTFMIGAAMPVAFITVARAASPSATKHVTCDRTPPRIVVISPRGPYARQLVTFKWACQDPSGVARCRAAIRPVGFSRGAPLFNGERDWLGMPRGTRFELRITATDRVGNTGTKRVYSGTGKAR